ncbi:MAG: hypothetical protein ACUZ8I_09910, partial [Candidatus Scalindua sp.]
GHAILNKIFSHTRHTNRRAGIYTDIPGQKAPRTRREKEFSRLPGQKASLPVRQAGRTRRRQGRKVSDNKRIEDHIKIEKL